MGTGCRADCVGRLAPTESLCPSGHLLRWIVGNVAAWVAHYPRSVYTGTVTSIAGCEGSPSRSLRAFPSGGPEIDAVQTVERENVMCVTPLGDEIASTS